MEDGEAVAQMVWFEQPATDPLNTVWPEHILYEGPDAVFRLETLSAAGRDYDVIISTEYFAEKLVVSWIERKYPNILAAHPYNSNIFQI